MNRFVWQQDFESIRKLKIKLMSVCGDRDDFIRQHLRYLGGGSFHSVEATVNWRRFEVLSEAFCSSLSILLVVPLW